MRIYGTGILKSMLIAYRNMFRKPITVQYPHERVELPERARWAVAVKHDENGDILCTGCLACERACPDYIIEMQMTTAEDRSKHIDHYRYEIGACMMCGLCVEACPFDAIEMSHDYELARIDPETLTIDLITDTPAAVAKRKTPPAQPAVPTAEAPTAAETPAPEPAAADTSAAEGGADV
jgi:NADH-quinone oxidoreductase subunit I